MRKDKKDVLIIDDDVALCDEVADSLRDEGYGVEVSHDGEEGNDLLARKRYDLVLLDLNLPGRSGFDILEGLRGKKDGFCVIVVTGQQVAAQLLSGEPSGDDEEEEQYEALNLADGIVTKPFDMQALLGTIRSTAGRCGEKRQKEGEACHAPPKNGRVS